MTARSQEPTVKGRAHEKGQRLYCQKCRAEIEIINPCTCIPSTQILKCCGQDMKPEIGVSVNLDD
jgi:hypothetical protein